MLLDDYDVYIMIVYIIVYIMIMIDAELSNLVSINQSISQSKALTSVEQNVTEYSVSGVK